MVLVKPASCRPCPLFGSGQGFSNPRGKPTYGVGLLGEALGEEEEAAGIPFVGKAGKQLQRMVERTNHPVTNTPLSLDDFLITNTLRCRPPMNVITKAPYEFEALNRCRPFLSATLSSSGAPKVWLALGNQALRALTGHWGVDSRRLRGYYFDGPSTSTVVGTYHPSYIMRGKWHLAKVFQMDLLKALRCAQLGRDTLAKTYITHPSVALAEEWAARWVAAGTPPLAFDIETPYEDDQDSEEKDGDFVSVESGASYTILRISFAYEEGKAISMPWYGGFIAVARKLLGANATHVGWNSTGFDIPRLEYNGCPVNGPHIDGMLAWHALEPALPMSLKYVATFYCPDMEAWALKSSTLKEYYNAADSDVTLRCVTKIRAALESQNRWTMFQRHFVELYQVLQQMSRWGLHADLDKRREAVAHFQGRYEGVVSALQPLVPAEVKKRKVYSKLEESLRKSGTWEDGRMLQVWEEVEPKPNEIVEDGWIKRIKKEKPPKKSRGSRASSKGKVAST